VAPQIIAHSLRRPRERRPLSSGTRRRDHQFFTIGSQYGTVRTGPRTYPALDNKNACLGVTPSTVFKAMPSFLVLRSNMTDFEEAMGFKETATANVPVFLGLRTHANGTVFVPGGMRTI